MVPSQKMAIAEQGSKDTSRQRRAVAPLRVFVVENHVDTREFLKFMLEELGHTVLVADTMAKALRDVPAANCDVLISDIGGRRGGGGGGGIPARSAAADLRDCDEWFRYVFRPCA